MMSIKNSINKRIIDNSKWQIIFSLSKAIILFISSVILARFLGPEKYGILQYAIVFYYFFQLFELFAHHSVVKKLLIEFPKDHNQIMGSSFSIHVLVMSITYISASIFGTLYLMNRPSLLIVFLLCQIALLSRININISFYYDSILESQKTAFAQFFGVLVSSIVKIIILIFTAKLWPQAILFSMQFILSQFMHLFIYFKKSKLNAFKWSFRLSYVKEILFKSTPLFFTALSTIIFLKVDTVMLEYFTNTKSVGIYSVAVKLSEPWVFICSALINSFFPSIFLSKSKSITLYYYKLRKLNAILFFIYLIIATLTLLLAGPAIPLIFGRAYIESVMILKVHIFSLLFLFWIQLQHLWEVKENFLKFALIKSFISAILNIVLNYIFIPIYGPMGAAIATLISYVFAGVVFNVFNKKSFFYLKCQLNSILFWRFFKLNEIKYVLRNL